MATYNKRGYKLPKEKEVAATAEIIETPEDISVLEKDSKTAGVFSALDESASKTEDFVAKNQNVIFGVVGAIALALVGYLGYQRFVATPQEDDAANEMFQAQQYFQQATDGVASDSLYKLSLKGAEGKFGFVDIADKYSGTDAGNLANYYAGIAYLNTGKFQEAINYLEQFSSEDVFLNALSKGAIGDAYSELNKPDQALEFYIKAAESNQNDFTSPKFYLKAGKTALALKKNEEALKYFTLIKEKFESAPEAATIDALIGLAQ